MRSVMVLEDFRVQQMPRAGGGWSYTILRADGSVEEEPDRFLRLYEGGGTERTYAYFLVDHLRWRKREGLTTPSVSLQDLYRYMGAVRAKVAMPFGQPWRPGKRPYGSSALEVTAACLKGFYLLQCGSGVTAELATALEASRLPTQRDRDRALLGHLQTSLPVNPLAPRRGTRRRHPKMLPDGARPELLDVADTARDKLVVTWLSGHQSAHRRTDGPAPR